jgi:WD40 repeat protein
VRGGTGSFPVPGENITAVAISGDGRFVATAASLGAGPGQPVGEAHAVDNATYAVTVTDTTEQVDPSRILTSSRARVTALAFCSSTDAVACSSTDAVAAMYDDGTAAWSSADGKPITAHLGPNPRTGFLPNKVVWSGERIATVSTGNDPELWDARTGDRLFPLRVHTQPVRDIAFDSSGRHLATVGDDWDVVIWDVSDGQPIQRRTFSSWGKEVAFSPDGKRVYIVGPRGTPYIGYLDRADLLAVARAHVARDISTEECERYVRPASPCPGD